MGRGKNKNHHLNTHLQKIDSLPIALQWGRIQTYWKKEAPTVFISNLSQKKLFILIYLVPLPIQCFYSKQDEFRVSRGCSWPRLPPLQTSSCSSSLLDDHPAWQHISTVLYPSTFKIKAGLLAVVKIHNSRIFFNV